MFWKQTLVGVIVFFFIYFLVNAGFNAQAHKLQKSCSRVTSLFMDDNSGKDPKDLNIWRSLSEMDLLALGKEANRARRSTLEEESQADKGVPQPSSKEEEAESDRDNSTQYCIHPPFDFPYFLLLQGYSQRRVRKWATIRYDRWGSLECNSCNLH